MRELKKYIRRGNWQAILEYGASLDDSERNVAMIMLSSVDIDADLAGTDGSDLQGAERLLFYENRKQVTAMLHYARIVCTRCYNDLKCVEVGEEPFRQSALYHYLLNPAAGWQPLVAFFSFFPPDYLDRYMQQLSHDRFFCADFKVLWKLYEYGWIKFEEAFFVRRLFTLYSPDNDHEADALFLLEHPAALNAVFLQFYKYEIPVLDRIKCSSLDHPNGLSIQAHEYWTAVFAQLLENDAVERAPLVAQLLTSLLNNWKKPHLDWHIRLMEMLQPANEDYLQHQALLLHALQAEYNNVLAFALRILQQLCNLPGFDAEGFISIATPLLRKERAAKTVLSVLSILDNIATNKPQLQPQLTRQICIALVQPDIRIQARTARMLVKYTLPESLPLLIAPYLSLLETAVRNILVPEMDYQW